MNDFNAQIIEEFRANGGKVGGRFEGAPMLLLTTTGAKSGKPRIAPLVYLPKDVPVIFASKAGAPTNPDWYHNILANPEVTIEVGTDEHRARAVPVQGSDRDALYAEQETRFPGFTEYKEKTSRVIPVIRLEPVD